jgi:alkanesulfonate monooxygenase SsuD/methylene tetrahydromethanopterin reductase-like flavin-dependent oxidoreductase (luciferase family)
MRELAFGIFDHMERTSGDPQLQRLFAERLELIAAAEEAGFWGYHFAEHHMTPLGVAPSPGVIVAAAAARTRRIRLGPMVYLLPLYNPLRLIEEICMLDQISGGRFELGVGRGVSPFELGMFRVPFYESREMYEDALSVLIKGLRNPRLTHQGPYYRYQDVPMELRPVQQPNPGIWYGCISEANTEYAARRGMHIVVIGPADHVGRLVNLYRTTYAEHRNDEDNVNPHVTNPKVGVQRHVLIAETDREAEAIARPAYKAFFDNLQKLWRDFGVTVPVFPSDLDVAVRAGVFIVGSVETVRSKLAALVEEVDFNYLVLPFAWGSLTAAQARRSLELFAREIMPAYVKRATAAGSGRMCAKAST